MSTAPTRIPLDRDRIVAAMLEIGVDRFSMHRVARHLGVSTTALYRYVDSKEALLAAAMDAFCERLALPPADLPWRAYLRGLALAFRNTLLAMPGAAEYGTAVGPATPAAFAIVERSLAVLRRAGFTPEDGWRAYRLVVGHAFHCVQGEERFAAKVAADGPGGYRIYQLSEPERLRFPELARMVASLRFDFDTSFQSSLDWILAGIAASRGE